MERSSGSRSGGSGAGPRSIASILGTAIRSNPSQFIVGWVAQASQEDLEALAVEIRDSDMIVAGRMADAFQKAEEEDNAR